MLRLLLVAAAAAIAQAIPQYIIDLDEPPEVRYQEVVREYRDYLIEELTTINQEFARVPASKLWMLQAFLDPDKGVHNIDQEILAEARGIVSQVSHPEVTLASVLKLNLVYELAYPTFCSGILAAMPNGTVVHGRNLDYFLGNFSLQEGIVQLLYKRGGRPLYWKVDTVGGLGVHSGMRFDGWSVEQNTRKTATDTRELAYETAHSLELNYGAARLGGLVQGYAIRKIMQEVPDYEAAVARIRSTAFAAPNYFVVAGREPFQGAVVSVDRYTGGPTTATVERLSRDGGEDGDKWLIIQTNDDRHQKPADDRRNFAQFEVQYIGRADLSMDTLLRVMQTPPMFNSMTLMTFVSIPAANTFQVQIHSQGVMHNYTPMFLQDPKNIRLAQAWETVRYELPGHLAGGQLENAAKAPKEFLVTNEAQPRSFLAKRSSSSEIQLAHDAPVRPHSMVA